MAVNGTHGFERKKTSTDKTKLNPVARDDKVKRINTVQFLAQTDRIVSLDLNALSLQGHTGTLTIQKWLSL